MPEEAMLSKLTLDTGKEVVLRELEIKHHKLAAQAAAPKSKGNQTLLSMHMQDEILKLLLVAVDGEVLKGMEKERFETLFSTLEYRQILKYVEESIGEASAPKVQMVSSSSVFGGKSRGSAATRA